MHTQSYHVELVVANRLRQIPEIPHLPLTLGRTTEACGYDVLRVADPDHLGTLRAVMRRPLLNDDVLARIEDTIHLVLCRYAEETAVVIPVQVLGKLLAIIGADFFALFAIPHFACIISTESNTSMAATQMPKQQSTQQQG